MTIYAFGATPEGHIRAPTRIYPEPGNNDARVAFHSWTHAILQTDAGLLELPDTLLSSTKAEVVGTDKPLALLEGGKLVILPSPPTSIHTEWEALAVTDAGPALGVLDGELYALPSLSSPSASGVKLDHPLLRAPFKVVATESRAAVLSAGEVIEAVWDWRDPGVPRLEVVEELSGLGVCRLVGGRGNRLGAVTAAGEGFVLDAGVRRVRFGRGEEEEGEEGEEGEGEGEEQEAGDEESQTGEEEDKTGAESRPSEEADINLVEDDDDIYHVEDDDDEGISDLALGPDFELVISSGAVWVRGNNDFGQLGQGHTRTMEGWVRVSVPPARRVFAGRFSAVVECIE